MSRSPVTVSTGPKIQWPSETGQSDGDPIVTAAVIGPAESRPSREPPPSGPFRELVAHAAHDEPAHRALQLTSEEIVGRAITGRRDAVV
jgi:hypothetical protein